MFPGDFSFEKVPECGTGRVYLLTFKPNNKKRSFSLFLLFLIEFFLVTSDHLRSRAQVSFGCRISRPTRMRSASSEWLTF